jgi:hypothetical protein
MIMHDDAVDDTTITTQRSRMIISRASKGCKEKDKGKSLGAMAFICMGNGGNAGRPAAVIFILELHKLAVKHFTNSVQI